MTKPHYGPADDNDFVVEVIPIYPQPQDRGRWKLKYASGHEELTDDANRVQQIMMDGHSGNRRTLR